MKRVLMIHYNFPPDGLVGGQITAKFAKYLPACGWEPIGLTVRERHIGRLDRTTLRDVAGCRVYRTSVAPHPFTMYRQLRRAFRRDKSPRPSARGRGARGAVGGLLARLRRFVDSLLSIPDEHLGWLWFAVPVGRRAIARERIDTIFSSGPPFTNHVVALILKRLTGRRWVACFEDPWMEVKPCLHPESVTDVSIRLETWLERRIVTKANAVVCLTEPHRASLARRYPEAAARLHVIPNGYDPDDFPRPSEPPAAASERPFTIVYAGTLYYDRTPRHLFQAVRALIDAGKVRPGEIRVDLYGACDVAQGRPVRELIVETNLEEVARIHGLVSREAALAAMTAADVVVLFAHGWVLAIPSKTYEYFRARKNIVALAPEGATADVVRRSGAGVVVAPHDVGTIATALFHYFERHRAGTLQFDGDPAWMRQFERPALTRRLAELL